jgi:hypothetical protein
LVGYFPVPINRRERNGRFAMMRWSGIAFSFTGFTGLTGFSGFTGLGSGFEVLTFGVLAFGV